VFAFHILLKDFKLARFSG